MVAVGYVGGDPNKLSVAGYTKGDIVAAGAGGSLAVVHVGANGQVLESDSTAADGVSWQTGGGGAGTPSNTVTSHTTLGQSSNAGVAATYSRGDHDHGTPFALMNFPPAGYNLISMSGAPEAFMGVSPLANNNPFFARLFLPAGKALTNVYVAVRDAGTYDGVTTGNTLNVYDDSVPTTQLGTIGETPSLWTANGWRGGAIVGGPIALSTNDRFIYVGAIARGMTVAPNVTYMTSAQDAQTAWFDFGPGQTHKRGMYANATALPASFDPTSFGTTTTFLIMAGIS